MLLDEGQHKVLIVEDDLDYRNALSSFLSSRGLTVVAADNGAQAMEKLLFHMPQLIILDLMLPKVSGFDVLARIREYPQENISKLPIVVLSNLSSPEDVEKAKNMGCEAYLIKSQNNNEEILKVVQEKLFHGDEPPNYEIPDFSQGV